MSKSKPTDFEQAYVNQWLETHKRSALVRIVLEGLQQSPMWSGDITTYIKKATDDLWSVDEQSLYRALRRLEKQGLLDHTQQSSPGRGGKRKTYAITDSGRRILSSIDLLTNAGESKTTA